MHTPSSYRRRSRQSPPRKGVATVEFALVTPAILVTFVAIVDFGRIFRHDLTLNHAARVGALIASDSHLADRSAWESAEQAAIEASKALRTPPTVTVVYGTDSLGNDYAEVTASAPFHSITRLVGVAKEFPVTRKVRMQCRAQEEEE